MELDVRYEKTQKSAKDYNTVNIKFVMSCIGFLAAIAMPYKGMAPFGIAFLSRERSFSVKSILSAVVVCLGSWIVCERAETTKYITAALVYLGMLFVLERDVLISRVTAGVVAGCSVFCTGMLVVYMDGFFLKDFFMLICEALIVFVSSVLLSKTSDCLERTGFNPGKLGHEEKSGLGLILVLIVMSLGRLQIDILFSVQDTVAVVVLLLVAVSGGVSASVVAGVILGIACGIDKTYFMAVVGTFGFCGLISGAVSKFGKGGVILGFVAADFLLVLLVNGTMRSMLSFYEIMTGAVLFALIPQKVITKLKEIMKQEAGGRQYSEKVKEDMKIKLKSVAGSFSAMSETLKSLSETREGMENGNIATVFDLATDRICKNCRKSGVCWNKDFDFTYGALLKMMKAMNAKGELEQSDADEHFRTKCLNLQKLITEINHQQDLCRVRSVWKTRMSESRVLMEEQLLGMSEIVERLAEEIEDVGAEKQITATGIKKIFEKKGIRVKNVEVIRERSGRYRVEITIKRVLWQEDVKREIMTAMKEYFDGDVNVRDTVDETTGYMTVEFCKAEKYCVETDHACRSFSGENGDNFIFSHINDGKFIIALSDGMGTGCLASRESEAMLELLENLLRAGFDSRSAVKFINSIMILKSEEEAFVTIDVCIIDLYTGKAEFIKTGAEPSFIIREGYTESVKASSLPVGIVAEMEAEVSNRTMGDGSVIVMATDGVETRESGSLLWIGDFAGDLCRENQDDHLARKILDFAIERNNGEINDDMTVLTVKLKAVG